MSYVELPRHKSKDISLYRRGRINYIVNRDPDSNAAHFVTAHGPRAPAMAWRVVDAAHAFKRAISLGAVEYTGPGKTLDVPALAGIGGSLLYLIDKYGDKKSPYSPEFA
jgi:4-hydroxyphenylpyruvate dioxygenase